MSAIDKLKDGIVIDAFGGNDNDDEDDINVVQLGTPSHHTIVKPKSQENNSGNRQPIMQPTPARKEITIDSVATPEEPDPTIKESYDKEILDLDDPNSIFSKYVDNKVKEANEWLAEKREEDMLNAEDEEINESESFDDEEKEPSLAQKIISESSNTRAKIQLMEDEDLSSLKDDIEEEEDNMEHLEEEKNNIDDIDEEFIDDTIEDEEVESLDDETSEKVEEVNVEESSKDKKEEPKKPVTYSAELDVEVSDSNENFTAEIVEEDETVNQEEDQNETLKHLQRLATEKLKPVSKKLDISSFTVLKKPVTNITPLFKETNARVCKWVLPAQESVVLMKEFSGAELEKLREYSQQRDSADSLNRRYRLIYDHIVSAKPANFETWLKTTPFEDIDHYFFAIYIASFKGANYLPADCINKDCKETFLSDDIEIMNMVKFNTKEGKNKFLDLYQSEATPAGKGVYCTEIVPISSNIAIAFRQPSVYNVLEIATLTDAIRNKYSSIIEYIPYIDTIYAINHEDSTLVPISYKMFSDNAQKTVRSKLQKYDNIFNTLSVDEFGVIKAYISALVQRNVDMKYIYPAIECPKCHTSTNEQDVTAEELVFTRYQLGALVNTSLN